MQRNTDKYISMLSQLRSGQPLFTDDSPQRWDSLIDEVQVVNAEAERQRVAVLEYQERLTGMLSKLQRGEGARTSMDDTTMCFRADCTSDSELASTQLSLDDVETASSDDEEELTLSTMDDMIAELKRDRGESEAEMLQMQRSTDKYTAMLSQLRSGQPLFTEDSPQRWGSLIEEVRAVNAEAVRQRAAVSEYQERLTATLSKLQKAESATRVWEKCD
jgi:hypothetical protein